jgi:hypothetical protein
VAKTVIVEIDGKLAMAVVPARRANISVGTKAKNGPLNGQGTGGGAQLGVERPIKPIAQVRDSRRDVFHVERVRLPARQSSKAVTRDPHATLPQPCQGLPESC